MGIVLGLIALVAAAGIGYLVYHFVMARWIVAAVVLVIAVALIARHLTTEAEERAALGRIDASEITLELSFAPAARGTFSPRGYQRYIATGRLFNNSNEYTLTEVRIRVRIKDCPGDMGEGDGSDVEAPAGSCIVVSEGDTTIDINVPPEQARDIVQQIQLPEFSLQGESRWAWSVESIRAQ